MTSAMQRKHLHTLLEASDTTVVCNHCSESDNSTADQLWLELGHCQITFTRSLRGAFSKDLLQINDVYCCSMHALISQALLFI